MKYGGLLDNTWSYAFIFVFLAARFFFSKSHKVLGIPEKLGSTYTKDIQKIKKFSCDFGGVDTGKYSMYPNS